MSSSLLIFIGGLASIYAVIIAKDKKQVPPNAIARMFADGIKTIAPAIGVCVFGYMIGALFTDLGVTDEMLVFMEGLPSISEEVYDTVYNENAQVEELVKKL